MSERPSLPVVTRREFLIRSPDSKSFISAKKTASMTLDDTAAQVDMVNCGATGLGVYRRS